jgi:hypothetical protein
VAPVYVARPLGKGVWLQLSAAPPANASDVARLTSFLQPILSWTRDEIQKLRKEAVLKRREEEEVRLTQMPASDAAETLLREAEERGEGPVNGRRRAVPTRKLDQLDVDVTLNVRLASPPTVLQQSLVELVVNRWCGDGFDGAFQGEYGKGVFHYLSRPSIDGATMRWHADLGSADGLLAIRALAKRLGNLPNVTVRRIDLGTEEVG